MTNWSKMLSWEPHSLLSVKQDKWNKILENSGPRTNGRGKMEEYENVFCWWRKQRQWYGSNVPTLSQTTLWCNLGRGPQAAPVFCAPDPHLAPPSCSSLSSTAPSKPTQPLWSSRKYRVFPYPFLFPSHLSPIYLHIEIRLLYMRGKVSITEPYFKSEGEKKTTNFLYDRKKGEKSGVASIM